MKKPLTFLDLSLYSWKFQRNYKLSLEILQIALHPLEIPGSKTKTHMEITHDFWKFNFFLNWPLEFPYAHMLFLLNTPGNSISSIPPSPLPCFWNNPINLKKIKVSLKNCILVADHKLLIDRISVNFHVLISINKRKDEY